MAEKNAAKSAAKPAFIAKVKNFFKGLKSEFQKISWPNREQTLKQTAAVVIISAVMCGFIRLIDVIAQFIIGTVSSIF